MQEEILIFPYTIDMFTNSLSLSNSEALGMNHQMMNVPAAWGRTKGEGIKVAVLDTGVPSHLDIHVTGSKSFVPRYSEDMNGHATHCCGILAASANGHGIVGIAPEIKLHAIAVMDGQGKGGIKRIIRGLRWAIDEMGVDIISMSLGAKANRRHKGLEKVCNLAVSSRIAVFSATGNDSSPVGQPACFDSVIAVGAVDMHKKRAKFSNYGKEVDFVAGGVGVLSCFLNNGYARLSGTSMACPAVAGIGALILSRAHKKDQKLSPMELKKEIQSICFDLGPVGRDKIFGCGIPLFKKGY